MLRKTGLFLVALALIAAMPKNAASGTDDPKMDVHFLLQPQITMGMSHGDEANFNQDMFLRRTRVILMGNVNKWVHFFFETDNPNLGKDGNFALSRTFTQDAFVDFRFANEFKVAVGLILLPFTRHNRQSAVSLMGLDYHTALYGGGRFPNTHVWRDGGVEARGIVADKLDYRVGIFRGFEGADGGINPDNMPRFTGRVAYYFEGKEDGFFYGGTYLGKTKIISVGAGFDFQLDGTFDDKGETAPYMAFTGDVFIDLPMGTNALTAQAAFMYVDGGYAAAMAADGITAAGFAKNGINGMGSFAEVGYLIGNLQPLVAFEWWDGESDAQDITNVRVGANYYIKGHNANVKLDYGLLQVGKDADRNSVVTIQTQLFF